MALPPATSPPPLYRLAAFCIEHDLDADQCAELARIVDDLTARPGSGGHRPLQRAARLIDAQRQQVQASIRQVLEGVDTSRQQAINAAALRAVEASADLDGLRPSALRPPQAGETAPGQLLIAQIADRLAHLVRAEVNACFDKRFGPSAPRKPSPEHGQPDDAGTDDATHASGDHSTHADD